MTTTLYLIDIRKENRQKSYFDILKTMFAYTIVFLRIHQIHKKNFQINVLELLKRYISEHTLELKPSKKRLKQQHKKRRLEHTSKTAVSLASSELANF